MACPSAPFIKSDLFIFLKFVNSKVDNINGMWKLIVRVFFKFYIVERFE